MKKYLSGLIAALMMAAGLVAFSGQSAQAACTPDKYTECPAVAVSSKGSSKTIKPNKKPKIAVQVKAQGVKPQGSVTITIKGPKTTVSKTFTVKNGKVTYTGPKLKKGTYKITISFKGAKGYSDAKTTYTLKVQ
jgi:Big-like domain-containing protein